MGDSQEKLEESLMNLEKTEEDESGEVVMSTFTCEICIEPMSSVEKFDNNERCIHHFCTDCLAKYIQAKVEERVANIKCPALNCNQLLDPLVCQKIISVELFNKWCDHLCDASLSVLHRCYCPYQNCSALVINECGEAVKKSKCPNCKRFFCFRCKVRWHAGFWCTESRQKRDANDVAFGVLLEKNKWNRCPYCGEAVERIDGCRMINCRCGFIFCYKCGGRLNSCQCGQVAENLPWRRNCFGCSMFFLVVGTIGVVNFSVWLWVRYVKRTSGR